MDEITQLGVEDFEELMDFLDFAFAEHGPHDFEHMLPAIYRRSQALMNCNYAIKREGAIRAVVGLFPKKWHLADRVLRVAGIGGVSTHRRYRGQGLMRRLMGHCLDVIAKEGCDLSFLSGQRQRYRYFGYELSGNPTEFLFGLANIKHGYHGDPEIIFQPFGDTDTNSLRAAKALHDAQIMHCERPFKDFIHTCHNWSRRPWAAFDKGGTLVGYLVADRDRSYLTELVAHSKDHAVRMVRAWAHELDEGLSLRIARSPVPDAFFRELIEKSERVFVRPIHSWRIFRWDAVLDALMRLRMHSGPLPDGAVIVNIEGWGSIEIAVRDGESTCLQMGDGRKPHLICDSPTAMRLFFGPLIPSQVLPLPGNASILQAWLPFPLHWPQQDGV